MMTCRLLSRGVQGEFASASFGPCNFAPANGPLVRLCYYPIDEAIVASDIKGACRPMCSKGLRL